MSFLKNRNEILDYIKKECFGYRRKEHLAKHPQWPGEIGVEVENIPLTLSTSPEDYQTNFLNNLHQIENEEKWEAILDSSESYLLQVNLESQDTLTFEPGGQVEFSSKPYPCLSDASKRLEEMDAKVRNLVNQSGGTLTAIGYHPFAQIQDAPLRIPKPRYQMMTDYFTRHSPAGLEMMRLTAAIQICLDMGEQEKTLAQRFFVSQCLTPFLSAAFANSPFKQGSTSDVRSHRIKTWSLLDPSRSGFPKNLERIVEQPTLDTCAEVYLDFVLNSRLIDAKSIEKPLTINDYLEKNGEISEDLLADALTLLFPEVRPKQYLEIRSVDSLPLPWLYACSSFVCGLIYDTKALEDAWEMLKPYSHRLAELREKSAYGLQDDEIYFTTQALWEIADQGYRRLPSCFRSRKLDHAFVIYKKRFIDTRRTPADDLIELAEKSPGDLQSSLFQKGNEATPETGYHC